MLRTRTHVLLSGGLSCWLSDGAAFATKVAGPAWSNATGWDAQPYYSTIRVAGPPCRPGPEVCDGKDNDCDGAVDEGCGSDGGPTADAAPSLADGGGGQINVDASVPGGDGAQGDDDLPGEAGCSMLGSADGPAGSTLLLLLLLWLAIPSTRAKKNAGGNPASGLLGRASFTSLAS